MGENVFVWKKKFNSSQWHNYVVEALNSKIKELKLSKICPELCAHGIMLIICLNFDEYNIAITYWDLAACLYVIYTCKQIQGLGFLCRDHTCRCLLWNFWFVSIHEFWT